MKQICLSRRSFVQGSAFALASATLGLGLAGCASEPASDATPAADAGADAATRAWWGLTAWTTARSTCRRWEATTTPSALP